MTLAPALPDVELLELALAPPLVVVLSTGGPDELLASLEDVLRQIGEDGYGVLVIAPTDPSFDGLLGCLEGDVVVLRDDRAEAEVLGELLPGMVGRRLAVMRSAPDPEPDRYAPLFRRFDPNELFRHFEHRERDLSPETLVLGTPRYVVSDVAIPLPTQFRVGPHLTSLDALSDAEVAEAVCYVYFTCDSDALASLRRISSVGGRYVPHLRFDKTDYRFVDRRAHDAMRATWRRADRVSHLVPIVHENICEALAMTERVDGDVVEIGVFLGGSALTALHYLGAAPRDSRHARRQVYLLDTYDGFNYLEAEGSADQIWAGTHQLFGVEGTIAHLAETFRGIEVPHHFVPSNICVDELPDAIERIAVANIDVDMYEPSVAALRKVAPLMAPGGIIIAEDPASTPGLYGAYLALHEFLESPLGASFTCCFKHGQYFLIKDR